MILDKDLINTIIGAIAGLVSGIIIAIIYKIKPRIDQAAQLNDMMHKLMDEKDKLWQQRFDALKLEYEKSKKDCSESIDNLLVAVNGLKDELKKYKPI
jgi:hypothetical protein